MPRPSAPPQSEMDVPVAQELPPATIAFVDNDVLTHAKRIADEKISHEKKLLDEKLQHEKREIDKRIECEKSWIKENLDAERKARELIASAEMKRLRAEKQLIEDEARRTHVQWRLKHPALAAEEDFMLQKEHARELERKKVQAEIEKEKLERERVQREQTARRMGNICIGMMAGGVIGYFVS